MLFIFFFKNHSTLDYTVHSSYPALRILGFRGGGLSLNNGDFCIVLTFIKAKNKIVFTFIKVKNKIGVTLIKEKNKIGVTF